MWDIKIVLFWVVLYDNMNTDFLSGFILTVKVRFILFATEAQTQM